MKKVSVFVCKAILGIFGDSKRQKPSLGEARISRLLGALLCALVFLLYGCAQLGETTAQGRRRHLRNVRINKQEMMGDVDRAMLLDEPSKLTDKRIP